MVGMSRMDVRADMSRVLIFGLIPLFVGSLG